MQLLIIKRRGAGSQFLLNNYPATAHMPGVGAKAGAPHAPIPNGGDVGMPKADEYLMLTLRYPAKAPLHAQVQAP